MPINELWPDSRHVSGEHFDQWSDVDNPLFYYNPDFNSACIKGIDGLANLEQGWDGSCAPRIDPAIIQAAKVLISRLPRHIAVCPVIVPTAIGGIQLEWNSGEASLELEFESPDTIHYLKWDPPKGIEEEDVIPTSNVSGITDLIRWFTRGFFDG